MSKTTQFESAFTMDTASIKYGPGVTREIGRLSDYISRMKKKLTARYVDTVTAPGPKRLEVYNQTLPGFGIRVSTSGGKTWFCSPRVNGRMKRIKIGTYPGLALSEARDRAREMLRDVQLGVAPADKPATLGEVVPQFIELWAKPRNRGWKEQERLLNQKWSRLFNKSLDDIERSDVVRILDEIVANGTPGRANHALAALKKLLNGAARRMRTRLR